jgi:hypothetical protein
VQEVYKEWELPKRPPPLPHPPRTLLPFAATSAYHDSFPAHSAQPVYRLEAVTYKGGAILSTPDTLAAKFCRSGFGAMSFRSLGRSGKGQRNRSGASDIESSWCPQAAV